MRVRGISILTGSVQVDGILLPCVAKSQATFSIPHEQSPRLFFTPHSSNKKTVLRDGFSVGCAGERNRTPDLCLEGRCFTTKLHPRNEYLERFDMRLTKESFFAQINKCIYQFVQKMILGKLCLHAYQVISDERAVVSKIHPSSTSTSLALILIFFQQKRGF